MKSTSSSEDRKRRANEIRHVIDRVMQLEPFLKLLADNDKYIHTGRQLTPSSSASTDITKKRLKRQTSFTIDKLTNSACCEIGATFKGSE